MWAITDDSRYSIFLLFLFVMSLTMKTCFRCTASAFATPAPAQGIAGLILLILLLYAGYSVPNPSMIGGLRWLSDINVGKYFCDSVLWLTILNLAWTIRFRGNHGQ